MAAIGNGCFPLVVQTQLSSVLSLFREQRCRLGITREASFASGFWCALLGSSFLCVSVRFLFFAREGSGPRSGGVVRVSQRRGCGGLGGWTMVIDGRCATEARWRKNGERARAYNDKAVWLASARPRGGHVVPAHIEFPRSLSVSASVRQRFHKSSNRSLSPRLRPRRGCRLCLEHLSSTSRPPFRALDVQHPIVR
jgi:hypothetical protein